MTALQDLQAIARRYESERDRFRNAHPGAEPPPSLLLLAFDVANASVRFLGNRRMRRIKENERRGVGPDDVKRLKIAQARTSRGGGSRKDGAR